MNFFLQDIAGSLLAACLFPIFLLFPGYGLAKTLNIWSFRSRSVPARMAMGLVLSISVTPGVTYFLARFVSLEFACAVFVIAALIFLAFAAANVSLSGLSSQVAIPNASVLVRWSALLIMVWMAVAIFLLSDLEVAGHLYPNVLSYDYTWRIAVTGSITRTGVPPANSQFYPGHPVTLYYYYFWFMTCSLVDVLGGPWIEPRTAVIAGTAWSGVGLIAIVALYIRLLAPHHAASRRSIFIALALLLVTGFDIVPLAAKYVRHLIEGPVILYPTAEWWNEQLTAWPTAVLWVPHHIAGLIATLTTFLVFSHHAAGKQALILGVCALALFSAVGLSVWVTFTFAAFWAAWIMVSFMKGWSVEARRGIVVAVLAVIFSLPYLIELQRASLTSITPIIVSVRQLGPLHTWMVEHHAGSMWILLADLVTLPLNYFMELGFFAIAGILYWKRRMQIMEELSRNEIALVTLAVSAFMIATFLRSNIGANDLGWRSAMFLQFALLIWSVDVVQAVFAQLFGSRDGLWIRIKRSQAILLLGAMIIGISPIVYDAVVMKLYPMAGDLQLRVKRGYGFLDESDLGRRYHDFREAYQWISTHRPEAAVVQHNPDVFLDLPSGLYGNRQVVVADSIYGTHGRMLGIPAAMYDPVFSVVSTVFASRTVDRVSIALLCHQFGIAALVVKDTDPIWNNPESWVFRERPVFENRSSKVFDCEDFQRAPADLS